MDLSHNQDSCCCLWERGEAASSSSSPLLMRKTWFSTHICKAWSVHTRRFLFLTPITHSFEACVVHSGSLHCVRWFFFLYICLPRSTISASGCLNAVQTTRHCGHSHRKLKRQTTSHPVWVFLEEALPPRLSSKCSFTVAVSREDCCGAWDKKKKALKKSALRLAHTDLWRDSYIHNYFKWIKQSGEKNPNNKAMRLVRVSDAGRLHLTYELAVKRMRRSSSGGFDGTVCLLS